MKQLSTLFSFIFILSACNSEIKKNSTASNDSTTKVQIAEAIFSFGTLKQTDSVVHVFKLKNVGAIPLLIKSAKASCGCTVPEYSQKPIPPNETASITVKFKPTEAIEGIVNKSIVIQANTDSTFHVLYVKGLVTK